MTIDPDLSTCVEIMPDGEAGIILMDAYYP